MMLWDCIGRAMPDSYEARLPAVIQDTLAQFDSLGDGSIRFPDFLEMLSRSPWRVLLPPQQREEITMPRLQQRENQKAFSASPARSKSPSRGGLHGSKYPSIIPPPPPGLHPRQTIKNGVAPLANSAASFEKSLRGERATERPKPLHTRSRSPPNRRSSSPPRRSQNAQRSPSRGGASPSPPPKQAVQVKKGRPVLPVETSIDVFLGGLEMAQLSDKFKAEGFEQVHHLLSVYTEFTTDDLGDLGVVKMIDRKRLTKALSAYNEVHAAADPRFDAIDTNNDGVISREEFDAANHRAHRSKPASPSPAREPSQPRTGVFGLPRQSIPDSPDTDMHPDELHQVPYDPFQPRPSNCPETNPSPLKYQPLNSSGNQGPNRTRQRAAMYDAVRRGKTSQPFPNDLSQSKPEFGAVRPMPTTTKETDLAKSMIGFHNKTRFKA